MKSVIRWTMGVATIGVMLFMAYLSLEIDTEIDILVFVILLMLTITLLYGPEELTKVIKAWRRQ